MSHGHKIHHRFARFFSLQAGLDTSSRSNVDLEKKASTLPTPRRLRPKEKNRGDIDRADAAMRAHQFQIRGYPRQHWQPADPVRDFRRKPRFRRSASCRGTTERRRQRPSIFGCLRQAAVHFPSDIHFKVASHRSWPRCMRLSSVSRRCAASLPLPTSSVTTRQASPCGLRYQVW